MKMFGEETLQPVKRDGVRFAAVIKIRMRRAGDDQKLLVVRIFAVPEHRGVGVPAEIAGVRGVPVDEKHRTADLSYCPSCALRRYFLSASTVRSFKAGPSLREDGQDRYSEARAL